MCWADNQTKEETNCAIEAAENVNCGAGNNADGANTACALDAYLQHRHAAEGCHTATVLSTSSACIKLYV